MQLKIEYLSKNDLKPYVNNAKIHTERQVEQIKKSIEEFSFNDPIAVWGENEIVEGHGRLLAAMEMDDIETVPVIRLDHLTDKQRKAYALAHNKLTMNTDFDLDILAKEIAEFEDELDLTDFGFNEAEILELEIDDTPVEIPQPNVYEGTEHIQNTSESAQEAQEGDFAGSGEYSYNQPENGAEITSEELSEYEQRASSSNLVTKRVIIVYKTDEEEKILKDLFGVPADRQLGVVYQAKDIRP